MARINITRIFETSRALATKSGQELQDLINYMAEAFSQVISALRNNLTIEDNLSSLVSTVGVVPSVQQALNANGKIPKHILVTRNYKALTYPLLSFGWAMNDNNQVIISATFGNSPPATTPINLTIVILF